MPMANSKVGEDIASPHLADKNRPLVGPVSGTGPSLA
jgi:hypothetical protein